MHHDDEIILGDNQEYYLKTGCYALSDEEEDNLTEYEKELKEISDKLGEHIAKAVLDENLQKTSVRLKPSTIKGYQRLARRNGYKTTTVMRLTLEAALQILEEMDYNPFFNSSELTF